VGAVEHNGGASAHDLHPPLPANPGEAPPDGLVADREAPFAQDAECPQDTRGVVPLVGSPQGERDVPERERRSAAVQGAVPPRSHPDLPADPQQAGLSVPADRFENRQHRGLPRGRHARPVGLDDARLLPGDVREPRPEKLDMVHRDVRDDDELGTNDMGGIESSPHAHLEDGDVHGAPREMHKGKRRGEFEVGHPFPDRPAHPPDQPLQLPPGNRGAVDPDALPEIDQVGRRVEPDAVSRRLQDGGQACRDGALAVGAPHEDAAVTALGISQARQQPPDGPQTRPDAGALQAVEIGDGIKGHGSQASRAGG